MHINELLKFVDENILVKKGERLNDIQTKVIEGALNNLKYRDIADAVKMSEGHVKDIGYEILQILSGIFQEPVRKKNLKSVLERHRKYQMGSIQLNVSDGNFKINSVSFHNDRTKPKSDQVPLEKQNKQISKIKRLEDLGLTNDEIAELLEIPLESVVVRIW
jgi:hypothetical protein